MMYQGILLLGAVLSSIHAGSYAWYLWQRSQKRQAAIICGACAAALMLAGKLVLSS